MKKSAATRTASKTTPAAKGRSGKRTGASKPVVKRAAEKNRTATPKCRYQPHPMLSREDAGKGRILAATGKSYEDWAAEARREAPRPLAQKTCALWLRNEKGLSSMHAMWIASAAVDPEGETRYEQPEKLVDALYSGPRASLRAIHERVIDQAVALGGDIVVTACKTMVPLYRKFVFAELRPVADGVEVLLSLGDAPEGAAFEEVAARNPGDRSTHRVVIRSERDLDGAFRAGLAKAYAMGAEKMSRGSSDVATPKDLALELGRSKAATATWEACTPAMRRDMIQWIESAKQAETRSRRVGQAIERLEAGKKRVY